MQIGVVAKQVGICVETIRYYEREGLISKSSRSASGYRQFTDTVLSQIQFIQYAKEAGFSLKDIRELQMFREDPSRTCIQSQKKVNEKVTEIQQKINSLENMLKILESQLTNCQSITTVRECSALKYFGS